MVLDDVDLLFFRVFQFPRRRLEVLAASARDDLHVRRTNALRRAAAIHRGVADTDDDHARFDLLKVPEVHVGQPLDADMHFVTGFCAAGQIQLLTLRRPTTDEDGIVPFREQRLHAVDGSAVFHGGTHVDDVAALLVQHLLWQSERRNIHAHQPARLCVLLVDRDVVAEWQQIVRDRQGGRSGTNQRDALAVLRRGRLGQSVGDIATVVGGDPLEATNRDGLFLDADAPAGGLAGTIAGATKNAREDVRFTVQEIRVIVSPLRDQSQIAGNVSVGRARPLAIHDLVVVSRIGDICRCHGTGILQVVWSLACCRAQGAARRKIDRFSTGGGRYFGADLRAAAIPCSTKGAMTRYPASFGCTPSVASSFFIPCRSSASAP